MTDPTAVERMRTIVGSERDPAGHAFASLAHALLEAGRPTDAHEVVEAGRSLHPDFATGHVVAGLVNLALAAREPARAAFGRVLQLDPDNRLALRALASIYEEDGEPSEALAFLEPLADIEPEDLTLRERIVRLQASVAAGAVASELPEAPDDPTGIELDAGALVFPEDGSTAEAEPVAAEPEDPTPDRPLGDATAEDALAWAQERGREDVPAEESEVVTRTLARLLAGQGEVAAAEAMYRTLITRDPEDESLVAELDALLGGDEEEAAAPTHEEPVPAHEEPVPVSRTTPDSVPIATLAPEAVSVDTLAPTAAEVGSEVEPASQEEVAPDATPTGVAELGPDPVGVRELAPEPVSVRELGPDAVPARDLAPESGDVRPNRETT